MLELGRDVLIRNGRRVRAMPGAAIRVDVRVRGLREGSVDLAPLMRAGCPVDGRANQRVAERHPGGERQQIFRFENVSSGRRDPEPVVPRARPASGRRRVSRRHEQQAARSLGQPLQPEQEALLDAGGDGARPGADRIRPRAGLRTSRAAAPAMRAGSRESRRRSSRARAHRGEPAGPNQAAPAHRDDQGRHVKLRQTGERLTHLSCREDERDLLREEPPGHERQGPRGGDVEPLGVVDDAEKWLLGRLGQQPEDRQATRNRSGAGPELSPNATSSASCWGCARRSSGSRNGEHSC